MKIKRPTPQSWVYSCTQARGGAHVAAAELKLPIIHDVPQLPGGSGSTMTAIKLHIRGGSRLQRCRSMSSADLVKKGLQQDKNPHCSISQEGRKGPRYPE